MSTLLKEFDKTIKREHNEIYMFLSRNNKLLLWFKNQVYRANWYSYLMFIFLLFGLNLFASFDFSSIPVLKHLNFIKLDEYFVDRILHEYTLYIGTFISITLIATTFLFNFLKEIIDSNLKLIVKYVNYEMTAYFGFSLILCLVIQKLISQSISLEIMKNLVVLDFYLVMIFIILLLRLYTKIFEIIRPTKLKEMYLNDTKKICAQNIFQELYEIKSEKIFKDILKEKGFKEISNSDYFLGDGPVDGINYLFNSKKDKYLRNVNFKRLIRLTKTFKVKQFVPVYFGQLFSSKSDFLLLAFENENDKFKENKLLKLFSISKKRINEKRILKSYTYTKKNIDKSIATDELDEKLEFLFDDLNDSVYKRNHKGVKRALSDLEVIIDLYSQNFE